VGAGVVKRPDFFIVGAPKCGTTAMYEYLRQHPQIFMPFHKEPLFFGSDLTSRYGRMELTDYLGLFEMARPDQRVGEASAWYLYSKEAAREICDFNPDASIIIMLRNPVDMMYAQHSQLLYNQQEDIAAFDQALAAEPDRHRGLRLPPGPIRPENVYYREAASFPDQVQRYLDVFGADRVHVVIFDDLRDATLSTYQSVLRFLRVSDDFSPRFQVVNDNKRVRNPLVQRAIYRPPGAVARLIPHLRRYRTVHRLRDALLRLNSRARRRAPMDPSLRASLERDFAGQIERLEALIGRDLSAWKPA
jgi:hypothetical protein